MTLLERDPQLASLHEAATAARGGHGSTTLVTGEAGIGKSSLVDQFTRATRDRARVLRGSCEALFSPRPLGPVHEVLHALGGPLAARVSAGGALVDVYLGLLDDIRHQPDPTVIVIEDVHWADEATLDFIAFVARRAGEHRLMLLLTYRSDEVDSTHPLTRMLGDLPAATVHRMPLLPLSPAGVERLARAAGTLDAELHRVTRGNPFFVTEVLRAAGATPITSIQDAVMSRVNRLSERGRHLLELAAVVPVRVELELLERALGSIDEPLEECVRRGLLEFTPGQVAFRHELARMTVHDALSPVRRMRLNREVLAHLATIPQSEGMVTRLAHHAIEAMDVPAILRYVREAALVATRRRSHREAAALLGAVLPHVAGLPPIERARFYEQRARALFVSDLGPEMIAMSEAAYAIWDELGDDEARYRNLIERADAALMVRSIPMSESIAQVRGVIAELEARPPGALLVRAYFSVIELLGIDDPPESARLLRCASAIPMAAFQPAERAELLLRLGVAEWMSSGTPRAATLERAMDACRAIGNDIFITRLYMLAGWLWSRTRELATLEQSIDEGLRTARARGLDRYVFTYALERFAAEVALARCDWDEASRRFQTVVARTDAPWYMRLVHSRLPIALIAARRGVDYDDGFAEELLTRDLASNDRFSLHRLRAELAWLKGEPERAREAAEIAFDVASRWNHPWLMGEAAFWRALAGGAAIPTGVAEPYALQAAGEVRAAAAAWERRGYRYEAALALACGDEETARESIRQLDALGAHGSAGAIRERLADRGVRAIPRGPRSTTRANAAGLTTREVEILALLAGGLSNADMAKRLHRSIRTVEHHVAVLLEKLDATSRHAAVVEARRRGLLENR